MLAQIRDHATGWFAWIIAIIIVIPFAFWGVHQYFSGGQEVAVATVNGSDIDQADYRRVLDNRREQMREMLGKSFNSQIANSAEFKRRVLDEMISRVLLSNHAKNLGYRVGDKELARTIRSNPRFRVGNKFSQRAYKGAVEGMGLTETGFESRYRQQLVMQQLTGGIEESAFVSPGQRTRLLDLLLQKRRFDYAIVDVGRFVAQSSVSEQEIRKQYKDHSKEYQTPERMKVQYVELSADSLAPSVKVTDKEIQTAYQENQGKYTTAPVRRASHILIKVESGADQKAWQAARKKAQALMEKLKNGADFAKLAKEYSDDPGSASKGGDLGRVDPGEMVKPFQDALFSLHKVGALAGPVKTRFGYHIIELTGYKPATVKPLSQVRDQVEKQVRKNKAEALFNDDAEAFRNVSYEQPNSLEPVAKKLGLKIQQSDWFTRNKGSGIAANPKVRKAAFGSDVFDNGLNSEAIALNDNALVVVRKLDVQPASVKPLKEVHDEIVARLKHIKAEEHVAALGPDLVKQLKTGTAWDKLVADQGLKSQDTTWSRAESSDKNAPNPAVAEAVFRAPRPEKGKPVYGGLVLSDGNYALFRLDEVIDGKADDASDDLKKKVDESLLRRQSQDMVEEYLSDLRDQAKIKIKDKAL